MLVEGGKGMDVDEDEGVDEGVNKGDGIDEGEGVDEGTGVPENEDEGVHGDENEGAYLCISLHSNILKQKSSWN